jgi:hypothetical protein
MSTPDFRRNDVHREDLDVDVLEQHRGRLLGRAIQAEGANEETVRFPRINRRSSRTVGWHTSGRRWRGLGRVFLGWLRGKVL